MNLNSVIDVSITQQSVHMSQAGFGGIMLLGFHTVWTDLSRDYSDAEQMLKDGFKKEDSLYLAASRLKMQTPAVSTFKIGRRKSKEPKTIVDDLNAVYEADSGFYGLWLDTQAPEAVMAAAEWVESKRMLFGVDVSDSAATKHDHATHLGVKLKEKGFRRTFCSYHPNEKAFFTPAWMGKLFPTPPGYATWDFKQLTGVETYPLSTFEAAALEKNRVNPYVSMKELGITLYGKTSSGERIGIVRGVDWLHARMEERIFMLFVKNPKIQYSEKGIDLVRSEIMAQLEEGIAAGVIAPSPKYEVNAPKVESISPMDRAEGVLPNVTFSAPLLGAIHAVKVRGVISI
jgi:hypothetical protein